MRKNYLLAVAAACATAILSVPNSTQAQTNAPAAPPPPAALTTPSTPAVPRFSPAMRNLMSVRNSIGLLERAIADLQHNDNDFGGHRQAAIDACIKARDELTEVAKQAGIPLPMRGAPGMPQRPMGVPPPPVNSPQPVTPPAQTPPPPPQ